MDVLPRTIRQLTDLFREMSLPQRAITMAVVAIVSCGLGWLVLVNQKSDLQPVSFGKIFPADELAAAEQALSSAGLAGFQRDGQRLLAPAKELDKYNAALLEFDALPADLGSQMLKQFESLGPFSTDRQRLQMKEALLLQELRRMIKAVPDIEDAHVVFANSTERRNGWTKAPRTTANVTIKPRAGHDISPTLVNSLRQVVANMVPDLKPSDVTIFNVSKGEAYAREVAEDPVESLCVRRSKEYSQQLEQMILKSLVHVREVEVSVYVDVDVMRSSIVRRDPLNSAEQSHQTISRVASTTDERTHQLGYRGATELQTEQLRGETEKQITAGLPRATKISITVPREFIREVEKRRSAKRGGSPAALDPHIIEEEVITQIERIVGRMVPENAPINAVSVTCVDRMAGETADAVSLFNEAELMEWLRRYSIPSGVCVSCLLLFAVLRPRNRWAAITPVHEPIEVINRGAEQVSPVPAELPPTTIRTEEIILDRAVILRDEVRLLIASDPTASATLLSQWLADAAQK